MSIICISKLATSKTSTITEHIEIIPGICGGKTRFYGHRIRVGDTDD